MQFIPRITINIWICWLIGCFIFYTPRFYSLFLNFHRRTYFPSIWAIAGCVDRSWCSWNLFSGSLYIITYCSTCCFPCLKFLQLFIMLFFKLLFYLLFNGIIYIFTNLGSYTMLLFIRLEFSLTFFTIILLLNCLFLIIVTTHIIEYILSKKFSDSNWRILFSS